MLDVLLEYTYISVWIDFWSSWACEQWDIRLWCYADPWETGFSTTNQIKPTQTKGLTQQLEVSLLTGTRNKLDTSNNLLFNTMLSILLPAFPLMLPRLYPRLYTEQWHMLHLPPLNKSSFKCDELMFRWWVLPSSTVPVWYHKNCNCRPPNAPASSFLGAISFLSNSIAPFKNDYQIHVCGDFNLPSIDWGTEMVLAGITL